MHKFFFLVLGLLVVGRVHAQSLSPETIATAGDHFAAGSTQMSWTLGEPIIETYTPMGSVTQLTQGFHQTNMTIVLVDDLSAAFQVRVYPNPTSGWVSIEAQSDVSLSSVVLSDAQGRVLLSQAAVSPKELLRSFDLSAYAPGLYLLHLRYADNPGMQTLKIVKYN